MEYIPFAKLRYKDKNYMETYRQVFDHADTIHLDFKIHNWPAFIVQSPEIFKNIIAIQKLNTSICLLCRKLPGVALSQFTRRCMVDEIVLSNGIEGVTSTRREINDVLNEVKSGKRVRFLGLVNKYAKLQENETLSLTSCKDIRSLYDELVLQEVLEEHPENAPDGQIFRKGSVSVDSATGKTLHQGILPESEIIAHMEKALAFLNDDKHDLLIRVAGFHYIFGYIHPFYDGNGRTSRFISSYLLSKELNSLIGYRLSYTIKEKINSYYAVFKTCNDVRNLGDVTPFVIVFLEIVREAMEQLKNALMGRDEQLQHYDQVLHEDSTVGNEKYYEVCYLLLQASLFSEEGIKTQELMQTLNMSRTTLSQRLKELNELGYITFHKEGREIYYKLNLDILADA